MLGLSPPKVKFLVTSLCVCNAENPPMRSADIDFALSVILHTLVPPVKQQVTPSGGGGGSTKRHLSVSDSSRSASVMSHHARSRLTAPGDALQTVAFLGRYHSFSTVCSTLCLKKKQDT